jgi:hypothetical protein
MVTTWSRSRHERGRRRRPIASPQCTAMVDPAPMIEDARDSLVSAFKVRLIAPFYGAFVLAWTVLNWRVPYATFVLSNEQVTGGKLAFVESYVASHPYLATIIPGLVALLVAPVARGMDEVIRTTCDWVVQRSMRARRTWFDDALVPAEERDVLLEQVEKLRQENAKLKVNDERAKKLQEQALNNRNALEQERNELKDALDAKTQGFTTLTTNAMMISGELRSLVQSETRLPPELVAKLQDLADDLRRIPGS